MTNTEAYMDSPKVLDGECAEHCLWRVALEGGDKDIVVVELELLERGADAGDGLELDLQQ